MMKRLLLLALCLAGAARADIYIKVTGANVRKAKLAVGSVHALSDAGGTAPVDTDLASKLRDQVQQDLEFTNLFDFINPSLFTQFDQPKDVRTIKYEDWTPIGASFVIKLGYKMVAGKLNLEAFFYDIAGQKKVFGTRYQYPAAQYPRLIHALSEDVLKYITGEKGLFSSRVLMVCRDLRRRRSPPKDVYIVDPDGRNLKQLTSDETLSLSPSWAPDGKFITYTQFEFHSKNGIRKKVTALKKHDLTTGNRVVLSARDGMNSGADWQPDGQKIAATLSYSGRPEIYLVDPFTPSVDPIPFSRRIQWKKTSGEGFQSSSQSLLFDVEPHWAPDGKKMVISSARTGHPMIYRSMSRR